MIKRTDVGRIQYPQGLPLSDRRHCRRMIVAVAESLKQCEHAVVSCSAGIDSTVLVHATGQAIRIQPQNEAGRVTKATAVYLNHLLRPNEVSKEVDHVEKLSQEYLSYVTPAITLDVKKGVGLQERARDARYEALELLVRKLQNEESQTIHIMTAHNSNDDAETKIFQFLKGKKALGISAAQSFRSLDRVFLTRPFLKFSREDIERYAKAFHLSWCEDSSNETDAYTRNKIRHHLIPWIEENINPGVVKTLSRAVVECHE